MTNNPITVAFGAALTKIRNRYAIQIDDVVYTLELNQRYYRHVESGISNLHVSNAFMLVLAFDSVLKIDAVIRVLMSISHIESRARKKKNENDGATDEDYLKLLKMEVESLKEICENEEEGRGKLSLLLAKFLDSNVFEELHLQSLSDLQNSVHQKDLVAEMDNFLLKYESYGSSEVEFDNEAFNFMDMPSTHLDFLIHIKEHLATLPLSVTSKDAFKWENQNGSNFSGMYVYLDNIDTLITSIAPGAFHYEYLLSKQFVDKAKIIYSDGPEENVAIDRFIVKLNEIIITNKKNLSIAEENIKLIKLQTDLDKHAAKTTLQSFLKEGAMLSGEPNALWVFTNDASPKTIDVGFLAYTDKMKGMDLDGYVLTVEETLSAKKHLQSLWSTLSHKKE